MNTKIFNYNGCQITFETGKGIMVNATEMAKPFEKRATIWLDSKVANEFINELARVRNLTVADLLIVRNGGSNPGTWMHEDVALEFARWLSPTFAIWCNDRIKELMKHGATAINPDDLLNPDFIISLATELKKERAEKEQLKATTELQQKELQQAAPKVQYHDEVLQAENTHTSTTIAKELGMSAQELHRRLNKKGIIFFHEGHWVLYSKYQGQGYTKTRTHTYEKIEDGQVVKKTNISTVWTEKGREFIHNILKPETVEA